MAEPQLKKRIQIPKDLSASERKSVALDVINFIKQRTDKGIDANGRKFAPYSNSYVKSTDFEIAGKSKSEVNLRLSDEMMESIELLDSGNGYIVIGFESGTPANDKAVWAQRDDNGPKRAFLDIAENDLERIIASTTVADSAIAEESLSLAQRILRNLGL